MLARGERRCQRGRQAQRETALSVVRDARRVAVPPARIDAVDALVVEVDQATEVGRPKAGFLRDLAGSCLGKRFAFVLRSGDLLPEAGVVSALNQQRLTVVSEDDD